MLKASDNKRNFIATVTTDLTKELGTKYRRTSVSPTLSSLTPSPVRSVCLEHINEAKSVNISALSADHLKKLIIIMDGQEEGDEAGGSVRRLPAEEAMAELFHIVE